MGKILHKKYEEFGDRLKCMRKKYFKTQESFAESVDVSVDTVRNWEQGRTPPETRHLLKIAKLLNCDLDYLTGRIDCKTHDLQFIHDQTGLSEKAIGKIQKLHSGQIDFLNQIIEHPDFNKAIYQVATLSDKEAINADLGAMIIHHFKSGLADKKTVPVQGNMIEKSMLFTLSNLLTRIICDITETEL